VEGISHDTQHNIISHSVSSDEGNTFIYDNPNHLEANGQRSLAWHDLEDHLLVTED